MPAASFLTPESQLGNFEGLVGVPHVSAAAALTEATTREAERKKAESFTVMLTPWLR
ncbi:hypothetical protein [Taklimakanibacter lacteus]|uniref:hypothetical protein n=1 Tax=Taklimakanibacter lacteus TaxID=2268456 RepID=UPI0034D77700